MNVMEFPLTVMNEMNSSSSASAVGRGESLYSRRPVVAGPYVAVLGFAAVVGTVGNLVVMTTVAMKHLRNRRKRTETVDNDAGRIFIANLAWSDLIVTAVINPIAIAGLCAFLTTYMQGRTGPPGYLALSRRAGWSGVLVGRHVYC